MAMMHFFDNHLAPLIAAYGSVIVAVLVGLESFGLPLPGESALVSAAIYAGTTHRINIYMLIASAAAGTIVGAVAGYSLGRIAGYPFALRYGSRVGITERRLAAGQYLFEHHGRQILFFSRFVAVLRSLAAFLAGVNTMSWQRFLPVTAAAGLIWAMAYGSAAYFFGRQIDRFMGPVGIAIIAAIIILAIIGTVLLHRHGTRLERQLAVKARRSRRVR
jgi:membrane protein DedA with SNARE-associated domain